MFCSKCGNPLPDDAKFCSACGAPVKISQEASPAPQQPAGIPDETVNIQAPKREPVMGAQNFSAPMSGGAAASGKKSKKGLAIGLSIGSVLIAVLMIPFRDKNDYSNLAVFEKAFAKENISKKLDILKKVEPVSYTHLRPAVGEEERHGIRKYGF